MIDQKTNHTQINKYENQLYGLVIGTRSRKKKNTNGLFKNLENIIEQHHMYEVSGSDFKLGYNIFT